MRNEQYRTYDRKRSYRQVVVLDEEGIDRILEQSPSDARYFVGVFVWPPAELEGSELRLCGAMPGDLYRAATPLIKSSVAPTVRRHTFGLAPINAVKTRVK